METKKRGKLCAVWINERTHKKIVKESEEKGIHLYRIAERHIEEGIKREQR